ncbi:MAG TPA: hypothetical protein VD838_04540, partial [Anaeromyxobacteraceae bacterium]|nr:hypothetical protein [Anaeromyxobacteraceae bacterium]
ASDMLDETGNAFTRAYYAPEHNPYLADYAALLAADLPTAYHVANTWVSYEKLRALLDERFEAWRRSRGGGKR